jgi:multidrug efflux pump subunit AcrA (membrane-fusion protein)
MYATVKFNITRAQPPLTVPDSTLVINAQGTQVATVTQNKTVHYQKVQLGRDNGTQTEILSGLNGNESLINNPTVDLVEGSRVQPTAAHS